MGKNDCNGEKRSFFYESNIEFGSYHVVDSDPDLLMVYSLFSIQSNILGCSTV